jgi:hypothetical protein
MNKKAFAVSVNFVIILILSIIVFTIGIYIVNRFFDFAKEEKLRWDDLTRREIDAALDSGDRIAIPRYKQTVANGEFASFGVGILNVLQGPPKEFRVRIDFALASTNDIEICNAASAATCGNPDSWLRTVYDEEAPIEFTLQIKNNEKKEFLVGFDVIGAPKGTYIYNVDIDYKDGVWKDYDNLYKLYVDVK